ncbi:interference hedgehog [Drosophila willistoni]|uniref:Interference hedgehog n=1 Tax=Drosophila willistoni TaxID=7260 RepID=IHOG_DROWI|nr:interference hedgehog [Drosophila willistoni]B4N072.1 RecName: Full=Interference hedgehog; Flags: Precursor [Drosophila willistoni]
MSSSSSSLLLMMLLLLLLLLTSKLEAIPVLSSTSPSPGVRILRSSESIVAPLDDEVVFECETSLPPERFEWSYSNTSSSSSAISSSFIYLSSVAGKVNISHEYAISRLAIVVRPESLGEYRCVGWFGPLVVTSTIARLDLASISLATKKESHLNWRTAPGNSIIWPCGQQVQANPLASWSFYKNGKEIQPLNHNGTLILNNISSESNGVYSCMATNTASGVRLPIPSSMELHVTKQEGSKSPYLLFGQPTRQSVTTREGQRLLLVCPGVGSPPPIPVWSSPNVTAAVPNKRSKLLSYGLEINPVQVEDAGIYICYLDNGIRPPLELYINVRVEQAPVIVQAPWAGSLTNESDRLQLECQAKGEPKPTIYWLLNGKRSHEVNQSQLLSNGRYLVLKKVLKEHAGYVQCFARNHLGEHSAGTLLQVNPKLVNETDLVVSRPQRPKKLQIMVPPSAPNVTRLSDESVMLRWHVQRNEGLPIQFFKVQYRLINEGKRKMWQTTNENIPYGKPKWNSALGKNFTASVTNLKPQRTYRFRIMAVYSNNDNKESNTSAKFFLQRGSSLEPMPVPELVKIDEYSETAVVLHWRLSDDADEQSITGYYAYYRPSSFAGEYSKATIEGAKARSFHIGSLEVGTIYEFKLQSFSADSASEFSALKQGRTQRSKLTTTEQPIQQKGGDRNVNTTPNHNETYSLNPLLTGTIGGGALLLLLLIAFSFCLCRRKNRNGGDGRNSQNKPRLAELREDFLPLAGGGVPGSKQRQRSRHIHITLNPLDQQQQQPLDEKNTNTNLNSPHLEADPELVYFQRQQQNHPTTYDYDHGQRRLSSSSLRRSQRTLERTPGSNNNLQQIGSETTTTGQRVILKRPRLSSRSENLSSGSLNSVGV